MANFGCASLKSVLRTQVKKKTAWWANPYLILFTLSLILRLLYFSELVDFVGEEKLTDISIDITNYYSAATQIYEKGNYCHNSIHTFGPGFPVIMVIMGAWVDLNPVVLSILNILIGALSTVLLVYFAYQLTSDMRVSILAGVQHALSLTSIALSAILLSETVFLIIILLGFVLVMKGLQEKKLIYYIIASMLFGAAALTRSVGQFLPALVLLIAVIHNWKVIRSDYRKIFRLMAGPILIAIVTLMVVSLWMIHNDRNHGFADLTLSAPWGVSKVVRLVRADVDNRTYEETTEDFFAELYEHEMYKTDGYARALSVYSKEAFFLLLIEHPITVAKVYSKNVWTNITADWGGYYLLITGHESWKKVYARVIGNDKTILRFRVILFLLLGIVALHLQRKYGLLIILLSITFYFGILSGFTLNQGPRMILPGQIGWAILLAYGLIWTFAIIKNQVLRVNSFVHNFRQTK